ncbi:MAG: hypothetical protein N4A33_05785 [Bacteriovoracaceae bacterium]|jgi:hypothetical protein|nr:hypothetical protein [Bacteriovoracaceae bacterium]
MKLVTVEQNSERVYKCFENHDITLYLWQGGDISSVRTIYPSKIQHFDPESDMIFFETIDESDYDFFAGDIYCYNEDLTSFFKLDQIDMQANVLSVYVPKVINVLGQEQALKLNKALHEIHLKKKVADNQFSSERTDKFMVYEGKRENLSEGHEKVKRIRSDHDTNIFNELIGADSLSKEDELYASKRSAPRAKPTQGKMVIISTEKISRQSFSLYDLSRGGMSILMADNSLLQKEDLVDVYGFDDRFFDEPMKAIIRSIKEVEESPGTIKVGMQFIEDVQG